METTGKMIEGGCEPDIVTYSTLISCACRDGKVQEAEKLLKQGLCLLVEMTECGHKPDLVTYGALIHGLVVSSEVNVALTIRDKMIERGVLPNA
ncbi:hypothetical protein ACH5RR_023100, partial [Cinchona calisaya]